MKVEFFWSERNGEYYPECKSELLMADGVDVLSCLLMDDGGTGFDCSIEWINEGIALLGAALAEGTEGDWGRESWAIHFEGESARIYFMDEESYGACLGTKYFESVLVGWRDFLGRRDHGERAVIDLFSTC
ncbi:MAG TPA: hypothetical protein DCY59_01750 [Micrococcaceae bacterium]|nr:hypothetical protein [Micrococcaceae bacterium]